MSNEYTLHYAPDNASFIIRIALELIGVPYDVALVDRSICAQSSSDYLALNPLGMIPALETPDGVLFETGAILLWLADRHDALFPQNGDPKRVEALKWLFFISNSLHAGLRQMFYPEKFIAPTAVDELRTNIAQRIRADFARLEILAGDPEVTVLNGPHTSLLDIYACACLRWAQIYPPTYQAGWVQIQNYPNLQTLASRLETLASIQSVQVAEGLGAKLFSAPILPNPPIGSAT